MEKYLRKKNSPKDTNNIDVVIINDDTDEEENQNDTNVVITNDEDYSDVNAEVDAHENDDRNGNLENDVNNDESSNKSSDRKRYLQKAKKVWQANPMFKNWIIIDENDKYFVKCKYCLCQIQSKYSTLKSHVGTRKHKKYSEPFEGLQKKIAYSPAYNKVTTAARLSEARTALYIACHSAIEPVKHLVACDKENHKNDPISQEITLGRTKCTAVIKNVWGPYFKEQLILDIGNSSFSLIIDEATDTSSCKYLGVVIKYYSIKRKCITTTFLTLELCEDCTAEGISTLIVKVLKDFNLSIENLSGLGTDNARVMVGVNNGVHKKLESLKRNKFLTLIPCACHSLQLAVTHAVSKCFPENLEFLASETYSWFSKSQNRQLHYKKIYKAINDGLDPLKITRACPTRWMSIETTLKRICEQWEELKTHFGVAQIYEKCYTSKILFKLYKDEKLYILSNFLKNILRETQSTNKSLQSKQCDPLKILDDLMYLVQVIAGKIYVKEKIMEVITQNEDNNDKYLLPQPYLGYGLENLISEKRNKKLISNEDEFAIRTTCVNFLKELLNELKFRLPKNIEVLKKISLFSVVNTLKEIKDPITHILEEMKISPTEIDKIQTQWNNITKQHWDSDKDTTSFWIDVYNFKNSVDENPFKELADYVISLLTFPFSNADVERLFSTMNLVKNKLRNRMKLDLLCNILQIREGLKLENSCCHSFPMPDEIVGRIRTSEKYEKRVTDLEVLLMEDILLGLQGV